MKGRPFVVETKFDGKPLFQDVWSTLLALEQDVKLMRFVQCCAGERMQVHVMEDEVQYYSRRGIEHGTYSHYTMLDSFIRKQLRETNVILDGEVVVWNRTK